ncbi:hypothetical protein VNO80_05283 [Phaseolus coccineus]|uniref:Transcription factor CBF/NF-Y/archaeal histone domain-containing protein n=1 Tax=Phaseolus coccineus TaxID=3886 RepID=A0AAN9RGK4_PHACN
MSKRGIKAKNCIEQGILPCVGEGSYMSGTCIRQRQGFESCSAVERNLIFQESDITRLHPYQRMIMMKVTKQQISHKLCPSLGSLLPITLVLVLLFSIFIFFSVSESSPSLGTLLIALLSTMFLVTLARQKGSLHENLVQDNQKKLELHPSLGDITTQQSCESRNIMDKSFELSAEKYEQIADPKSKTSLPSDTESNTSSTVGGESTEIHHSTNQNLDISDNLEVDSDDDYEEEDGLIEIKLPNNHFSEFWPECFFKQQGFTELLAEINEMNEDENLIEIDISKGSTKQKDLRLEKELVIVINVDLAADSSVGKCLVSPSSGFPAAASFGIVTELSMADSDNDSGGAQNAGNSGFSELSPREQDRFLPIANVSRIMKKALPANAKISKDAKETVQECVSEFISFITGEASDKCQREKRKTINGDDLLWAMTTLGFEDYVEPLKIYLQRFREIEGEKTVAARDKEASSSAVSGYDYSPSSAAAAMMHHQGHVYGSPAFHQVSAAPVMGKPGPGPGPSYPAPGRPR